MEKRLRWLRDDLLEIGEERFVLVYEIDDVLRLESTRHEFVLGKAKGMVEMIRAIGERLSAKHIFEVGIFKGGSTVLYDLLFEPARLVAVDISGQPVRALDEYLHDSGRDEAVQLHYGVDQGDTRRIQEILEATFPGRTLDLVVDDASHQYAETKASFNAAFPRLRPGGAFVIEDWAWAHWPGDTWQKDGGLWPDKRAMSNLVVELMMACASAGDLIEKVEVTPAVVVVTRGQRDIAPEDFDISRLYLTRGRPFELQL